MNYIPNTKEDEVKLLKKSKVSKFSDLIKIIPKKYILKDSLGIGKELSELEIEKEMIKISKRNNSNIISFLGSGIYDHYIPSAIDFLSNRSEFYTAYTPYQAEVSQGTLQALYEYQTMICNISNMEIANASLYDGASAIVEACILAVNVTGKNNIIVSATLNNNYKNVAKSLLRGKNINFVEINHELGITSYDMIKGEKDIAAVIIQSPNTFGLIENWAYVKSLISNDNTLLIAHSDPLCLSYLKSPGECGADIYIGDGQTLGNPISFGGPLLGIFATKEKYKRLVPGRIVGKTIDKDGNDGFVLTLQTREQHIRREKATSNICTNQGLLALRATIYMALMGEKGMKKVIELCYQKSHYAANKIDQLKNYKIKFEKLFLKEFVVETDHNISKLQEYCYNSGFIISNINSKITNCFQIAITEKISKNDIDNFIICLKSYNE